MNTESDQSPTLANVVQGNPVTAKRAVSFDFLTRIQGLHPCFALKGVMDIEGISKAKLQMQALGMSQASYDSLIKGQQKPGNAIAKKCADYLGITTQQFLDGFPSVAVEEYSHDDIKLALRVLAKAVGERTK